MKMLIRRTLCVFAFLLAASTTAAKTTLIKNAILVPLSDVPLPDTHPETQRPDFFRGYILFNEEKILALAEGDVPGDLSRYQNETDIEVIDAAGRIVMPGFVSGHNHLWQSAFRGLAADKELYGWLGELHFRYGSHFSDGDMYAFTLHGSLDQLTKGITTSYDHSQRLGSSEIQYREAFQAGLDSAQHFIFSYNANLRQTDASVKNDVADFVSYARPYIGQSSLLGLSLHSVGAYFGEDKLRLEMEIAKKHKLGAQIHYLEEYQRRYVDRKKWPLFLESGAVNSGVSFAHFIHTSDKILQDSAKAGASMIWNPLSNGRLASGLPDIPKYLEMGVKVGMGVDGAASADIADPFENMRMGLYGLRMQQRNANVMLPIEILKLHTLQTAQVLQVDTQVGSLEAGKKADLLIIDPANPPTGALFDPLATLVFACNARNIDSVFVNGKLVVKHGSLIGKDMRELQHEVAQRVQAIRTRAQR